MADAMDMTGLASLLSTIHGIYPQARVTSGYRGPNNPLTLRNPSSMHAMGSPSDPRAVDVAPIPGVNFNDYVSSVKKAGVPIAQAFDESSHPFPWTTGPNWHLATGQQPQPTQQPAPYYNPQPGGQPPMPPQTPPQGNPYQQGQQMAPISPSLAALQNPMPQAQGPSLGAMAQSLPGSIPAKKHSAFNVGNVLGVLGDALSAYGGRQPTFGPMLNQEHMMEQQQGFEREKFNQELQMRMYAMTHPADIMESQIFQGMPPSQQRAYLKTRDAKDPLYTTLNGSQVLQKRVQDPPAEAVAHLRGAIGAGGDQAGEFAKFNQIFGPGAAEEALGAQ